MTRRPDEPQVGQALDALTGLARESVKAPSPARLNHGLQALSARIDADRTRRRRWVAWSLAGATATAAIAYVLSGAWPARPMVPPLTYRIEGGSVGDGGYLRESGGAGMKVAFSEGSQLVLLPGSRGRLRNVEAAGARVAIEQGTASFQVTPRSQARWMVDVGPFLVRVTGTVFTVSWDAAKERFEIKLQRGRVIVSGPMSGGDIALRDGQRLVVNLPKAETLITEHLTEEPQAEPTAATPGALPAERPLPSVAPTDKRAARPAAPAALAMARSDNDRRWSDALAAGRLDQIFADVARAGLRPTLEKASSEDLFALAMAARYRRRVEVAREALLAERRRFPASDRALDSAFLLGRLAESGEGGTTRAIEWYDEYLTRAPAGTYAAEALGRKMIVTSKIEGASRAQPLAEEYLRRFPNGSYAGSARVLRRAAR